MSLYGKTIPLTEFLWFCGPHLRSKLFSEKALLQKAKHVRRKVVVAGKTLRIRRSQKQRVIDVGLLLLTKLFLVPIHRQAFEYVVELVLLE